MLLLNSWDFPTRQTHPTLRLSVVVSRGLCALAGVIAMHPKVCFVPDEPNTSGLDPYYCSELRKIINTVLEDGCNGIELTHSMEDAAETGLRLSVLHEGDHLVFQARRNKHYSTRGRIPGADCSIPHLPLFGRNVYPALRNQLGRAFTCLSW